MEYAGTDIESLSDNDSTSSGYKPLGFHGTCPSKLNSYQGKRFHSERVYIRLLQQLLLLGTAPKKMVIKNMKHVITGDLMDNHGKIEKQRNLADKKFGKGQSSFTGQQNLENRELETITPFPGASKTKSSSLKNQPTINTMYDFDPGSDAERHKVKYTHTVVSVREFKRIQVREYVPEITTLENAKLKNRNKKNK
ncbi:hypothetical protein C1645_741802 [Glomus cerebriforme]|uniref:Uncharacterized protein n=1 Tax=Glomus cerebriforme TaxID=658196 RepID=A0A397SQP9_9GLOM|nr:hypothetical protein C1645_741802 [Glomus cerebriforme]